ncbi:hypothetical protein GCM10011400_64030 [Paraburkholderia caffeinilytica]|jgi:hypothetical protein|uniref:Uncharacterized protein n=1 Tax=Paraburkholderia caffeinilytica TaxID=1761016 RepID=A0ABQ1NBC7_9BURK|nr:hypothetical protein GCM10011400_64030 [Paraburkholderia caffeinilytica]CAB3804185.1 hypothetical protein LMG28690_05962 [Paraburkholderia caffeinilytica]
MDQTCTRCYYRGYVAHCVTILAESGGYQATVVIDRGDVRNPSRISYPLRHLLFSNGNDATCFALRWAERRIDSLSTRERQLLREPVTPCE